MSIYALEQLRLRFNADYAGTVHEFIMSCVDQRIIALACVLVHYSERIIRPLLKIPNALPVRTRP